MTDSILTSIKKLLGPEEIYTNFDTDIIIHINSALAALRRLGVGPPKGFRIQDATSTWSEFLGERKDLEDVKTYVYLKVRLLFDPPTSATVIKAYEEEINKLEWTINEIAENPVEEVSQNG